MKANLDREGIISIEAEGDLEDYALVKWVDDFEHDRSRLRILVTDNNKPNVLKVIAFSKNIRR